MVLWTPQLNLFGLDDLLLLQKHLTNVKVLSFGQRFLFTTPNPHDLNKHQQRVCLDYGWAHILTNSYALIVLESAVRQLDPLYDLFCPRTNVLAKENFVGP